MNWWKQVRRAFRRSESTPIPELGQAPGPSPWYLRWTPPAVHGFSWIDGAASKQAVGAFVLSGSAGSVLILDFHNYVLPLDRDTLLVWHQRAGESGLTPPVVLRVFFLPDLLPLQGALEDLCASMRNAQSPFRSASPPVCEFPLPTTVAGVRQPLTFPDQLRQVPELLILCASSGAEPRVTGDRNNLGLLVASPRDGWFQIHPQDWFNRGGFDYSYEWVTRVARDPRTGRIHGEGIRIQPFVLDETLRKTR